LRLFEHKFQQDFSLNSSNISPKISHITQVHIPHSSQSTQVHIVQITNIAHGGVEVHKFQHSSLLLWSKFLHDGSFLGGVEVSCSDKSGGGVSYSNKSGGGDEVPSPISISKLLYRKICISHLKYLLT
jgi:hypothetical protein